MRVVKIEWIDSCTSNQNWILLSDELDEDVIRITTYGFLIQENDEFVTIAQNYGINPEQVCNLTLIPKGCIKSITDIKCQVSNPDFLNTSGEQVKESVNY